DGAGLENQWAEMSRGFESHGLRHFDWTSSGKTLSWFFLALGSCASSAHKSELLADPRDVEVKGAAIANISQNPAPTTTL
ncbi:MAG: hypothetical protein P8M68_01665, partial [Aquiluna sp.]|nr:hypothetical protein [Aquiluna sp.]